MPSNTDQLDVKLLDNIEWLRDDGSNWKVWKAQTIIALEHREVLDFIENPIPQPTPIYMSPGKTTVGQSLRPTDTVANADDIATWDRNNCISKMQIFMTLEHAIANLYDDKAIASELWNALRAHCRQDNGPISELPTETKLMARACHYHHPEICYEFDMQKLSIPL